MQNADRQNVVPHSAGTAPPKLKAPANATDSHIHVYDARFKSTVPPMPHCTVDDYRLLQQRLGTRRVVLVGARDYEVDNSILLDAISALGIDSARAIGVVRPDVSDAELKRLDAGGIRGLRFSTGDPETDVVSIDMIEPLAKRIADLGWHLQLNLPMDDVAKHAAMLKRLPAQLVFDGITRFTDLAGINHPACAIIASLLEQSRAWLKITGAHSTRRPPDYSVTVGIAKHFVRIAPERMVWGSGWPHTGYKGKNEPDDAVVFDLLSEWAPDESVRNKILVSNPEQLYGFPRS